MTFERTLLATFGIVSLLGINALSACSGSDDDAGGTGGGPGAGGIGAGGGPTTGGTTPIGGAGGVAPANGGAAPATGGAATGDACSGNYSSLTVNGQPASLKDDLLPIFGLSCSADACHSSTGKKANLYLGPKCTFDDTAAGGKWKCAFPAAANPDPTKPQPITPAVLAEVMANLSAVATTVNGGATKRVTPGDPGASFLVDKIAGLENSKGFSCTNQDPSHSAGSGQCGDPMPLGNDPLCKLGSTGPAKFNVIAQWVKNGALNN